MRKRLLFTLFAILFCSTMFGQNYHWTATGNGDYTDYFSINAVIQFDGVEWPTEEPTSQLELAAFYEDECRATTMTTYTQSNQKYMVRLRVYGDVGQIFTLKLYDHASGKTYTDNYVIRYEDGVINDLEIPFVADERYGTIASPATINFKTPNYYTPNTDGDNENITLTAVVLIDGVEQYDSNLELGVFCGNVVKGSAKTNFVDTNNGITRNYARTTVSGKSNDVITFRLYNHATGEELEFTEVNTINFVANASVGTILQPFEVNFITASYVAKIGDNKYTTFEKAYEAAADGDDIVLLDDITLENNPTVIAKDINITLGNFTINGTVELANIGATITGAENGVTSVITNVADYKVVYEDDKYQVVAKVYVAQVGEVKYESVNEALAAAQPSDEILLLQNVTLSETMTIEKAITLDLGTKTVTGADGAIVFDVKAATTIKNGTVLGNKSGTSSGLIDIYADINLDDVTIETSKINALRFKAGECTAVLENCNVTGAFKGYGGSVWEIKSGVYKASSTSINDQINGTARISGGTFHYEIAEEECAPGYVVKNNGDGTWTVEYAPAAFVDANNNGTLDEGEAVYGNLDQIFANHQEGDVYVVLTADIVANAQVDTDADAHYYFTTNVEGGVTMDFLYEDNWNYIQKMTLGENITLNAKHLLAWTEFNVSGTINTDYLYTLGANTTITETGVVNANAGDATVQVKDNATFTVNGKLNTAILNVWVNNAKLIVDGANAVVNANWVDIWDGTPSVTVQNGATLVTLDTQGIKASRGGSITVDNATLTGKIELGHNGESAGQLTVTGNSTLSPITLTVVGSTVEGPEGLDVTTNIADHKVVYENGVYQVVAKVYVAQVGEVKYESLQAALAAATDNCIIELLTDVEISNTLSFSFNSAFDKINVTFNGNGKTIKAVGNAWNDNTWLADIAWNVTLDNVIFDGNNTGCKGVQFYTSVSTLNNITVKNVSADKWGTTDYAIHANASELTVTGALTFENCKHGMLMVDLGNNTGKEASVVSIDNNATVNGVKVILNHKDASLEAPASAAAYVSMGNVPGYTMVYENGVYKLVAIEVQTITLEERWNWVSHYVVGNTDSDILTQLQNGLGTYGVQIKNQFEFTNYNTEDQSWSGNLYETSVKDIYKVNTSLAIDQTLQVELSGVPVDPAKYPVTLEGNWNYLGYPLNEDVSVGTVFAGVAKDGDYVKSQDAFAEYYNGNWHGNLKTMKHSEGYMYRNILIEGQDVTKILVYSYPNAKEATEVNITSENNYWVPASSQYPGNMTMVAMLDVKGSDYEVAALVNGEVRGSSRPVFIESLDAYMFFLTIHGDEVAEMTFKVYDLATGEEYSIDNRMNYSDDAVVGSVRNPYMLTCSTLGIGENNISSISIYPNPTTTDNEINLGAECDTVEVFNALGVKVAEYTNVDTIDALETAGVYVIRITNDGNVQNCRLIVK